MASNKQYDWADTNTIRLVRHSGTDADIVRAARVCTETAQVGGDRDRRLIETMMISTPTHNTPFEHVVFTWEVVCPIFVARQLMRHRIASYNERSLRFTEPKQDLSFYVPTVDRIDPNGEHSLQVNEDNIRAYKHIMYEGMAQYRMLVQDGWPKEVARGLLGMATTTQFVWTINCWSFLNFIEKRAHRSAQLEHRLLAEEAWEQFAVALPITATAFFKKLAHHNRAQFYPGILPPERMER